jgi:glutamate-1-semialdehyde 2,1-aminomutase
MLDQGIYLAPSQYESLFVSAAITPDLAREILAANERALGMVL